MKWPRLYVPYWSALRRRVLAVLTRHLCTEHYATPSRPAHAAILVLTGMSSSRAACRTCRGRARAVSSTFCRARARDMLTSRVSSSAHDATDGCRAQRDCTRTGSWCEGISMSKVRVVHSNMHTRLTHLTAQPEDISSWTRMKTKTRPLPVHVQRPSATLEKVCEARFGIPEYTLTYRES